MVSKVDCPIIQGHACIHNLIICMQDVDMIVAGLIVSFEREKVVDFSYPFWYENIGMLTATFSEDQFYIFKPLEISIWLCYICAALSVSSWLYLPAIKTESEKTEPGAVRFIDCVWYTLRIAACQGMLRTKNILAFITLFHLLLSRNCLMPMI